MCSAKYLYEDYDYVLIVASWGLTSEYKETYYTLELEKLEEGDYRRTTKSSINERKYSSSTGALKDILLKILSKKSIGVLIFDQDTILMDTISKRWSHYENKEVERVETKEEIINQLYSGNIKAAEELGFKSKDEFKRIIRIVPGVLSHIDSGILYSWRGERVYDVITGLVTLYTYDNLINSEFTFDDEVDKIAILLDTTHGVNYLVTSMKEGITIGATLYALNRISRISPLKELTIYHYNSDPITKVQTPSLKLHLLSKKPIVKEGNFSLSELTSLIEDQISIESVTSHEKRLSEFFGEIEWNKIIESLILFSKGVLVWALRILLDLDKLPDIDKLMEIAEHMKIKFSKHSANDRKIDYVKGEKTPTYHVITYLILSKILKNIAKNVKYKNENKISTSLKKLRECICFLNKKSEIEEILKTFLNYICDPQGKFVFFDISELVKIIEKIYSTPYKEINKHELEDNLKNLLSEKSHLANEYKYGDENIYIKYGDIYSTINFKDTTLLIPNWGGTLDPRHFYAHAGLIYGLKWFGLRVDKEYILCLGKYEKITQLIRSS